MVERGWRLFAAAVLLGWCSLLSSAQQPVGDSTQESGQTSLAAPFLLGPPPTVGPVVVRVSFYLEDLNEINDEGETFAFVGVLTLTWQDERQRFDPAVAGVTEKIYQGSYQWNEVSPSWFPQVVLVNESGGFETRGVLQRGRPDGTQILIQSVSAVAKSKLNMWRFPFDQHRFEAIFEVLGFDRSEVTLESQAEVCPTPGEIRIPQWTILGASAATQDRPAPYVGPGAFTSAFVVSIAAQRQSFFMVRLVMLPLVLIVLLSFSVFWMDRSTLGDRISVSFIGILTGVAYQIVMSELLPRISYPTLMNGFLSISFITMCATVVINLVVGALDRQGRSEVGNRVDRACRWAFPLGYSALIGLVFAIVFLFG